MHLQRLFLKPASQSRLPLCRLGSWVAAARAIGRGWVVVAASVAWAGSPPASIDLTELTIEELAAFNVATLTRKEQPVHETAAAVTIVTGDDLRRSGVDTVPEALRLVPGMHVARTDSNGWAISARGFSAAFATKMLVLFEGRTIYTPYLGGVFWEDFQHFTQDLQRIEVIRGPGASLWGANAVNGIVNVVSKPAKATQGALVSIRARTHEPTQAGVRYGGQHGANLWYRIELEGMDTDAGATRDGDELRTHGVRAGTRADWEPTKDDRLSFHGHFIRREKLGGGARNPVWRVQSTAYAILRWDHRFSHNSDLTIQGFADSLRRKATSNPLADANGSTEDIDGQHRIKFGGRHDLLWGGNIRREGKDVTTGPLLQLRAPRTSKTHYSGFVQDEITLIPQRLRTTLGAKLEKHEELDREILPTSRFTWTPDARHTLWTAVSRAVRSPVDFERDFRVRQQATPPTPTRPATQTDVVGTQSVDREVMRAYEVGYRFMPRAASSIDVTAYIHDYGNLRTIRPVTRVIAGPPPLVLTELQFVNALAARSEGMEVAAKLRLHDDLRFIAGYSWQQIRYSGPLPDPRIDSSISSPKHMASLRAMWNLPRDWEVDVGLYYVDRLSFVTVPSYFRGDLRIGWRPRRELELSAGVQNAFDNRHREYPRTLERGSEDVARNVYLKLSWRR